MAKASARVRTSSGDTSFLDRVSWFVEIFVAANLGFLSLDVLIAHEANAFRHPAERVPVVFGVLSALLLAIPCFRRRLRDRVGLSVGYSVGSVSIVVGVAGMLLHVRDTFLQEQSLHNLVYTAPFAAPLSYVGLGLLLLLNRMERREGVWAQWVVLLALGGFVGTFALALADHAQNGFFEWTEWVGVVASAFAVGFLLVAAFRPVRATIRASAVVVGLATLVGMLGFALHAMANTERPGETFWDALVYGAPPFAPLLLCDLALLAGLGLWTLGRAASARPADDAAPS
jgi:hypothetical protein